MVEFFLILSAIAIYFTPLLVAAWLRHPRLAYIGGLNAALGVTIVGWAGALMWALRRRKVVALSYHGDMRVPRSFNTGLLAASGLVVGVAMIATIGVNGIVAHRTSQASTALYATDAVTATQWRHSQVKGVDVASLPSTNNLTQPAPFKGGPATLSVARGTAGTLVTLDLDGELACSYAPTASSLQISFDGGPAQTFACAPAPAGARPLLFDGDHSKAYLADPVAFLTRLKGARHIDITANFADMTDPQTMTFDLPAAAPIATAPAMAMAAVSPLSAANDAASVASSDTAGEGDHEQRQHHRRHAR